MNEAVGIRLEKDMLKKIKQLEQEEAVDRSTMVRKLILLGYHDLIKKKAAEDYFRGKLTFSAAAQKAGLTLWEMEQFLIERGYRSSYSLEDLREEVKNLRLAHTK